MTTTTAPPGIDPADWARMSWWQQERCMARLERESRARLNQLRQAHTRNVTAIGHDPDAAQHLADLEAAT